MPPLLDRPAANGRAQFGPQRAESREQRAESLSVVWAQSGAAGLQQCFRPSWAQAEAQAEAEAEAEAQAEAETVPHSDPRKPVMRCLLAARDCC